MKFFITLIFVSLLIVSISSENTETDEFIPTNEWQTVKESIYFDLFLFYFCIIIK